MQPVGARPARPGVVLGGGGQSVGEAEVVAPPSGAPTRKRALRAEFNRADSNGCAHAEGGRADVGPVSGSGGPAAVVGPSAGHNTAGSSVRKRTRTASAAGQHVQRAQENEPAPQAALEKAAPQETAAKAHHQDPPALFTPDAAVKAFDDGDAFVNQCLKSGFRSEERPENGKRCGPCCRCGKSRTTTMWRPSPFDAQDLCNSCGNVWRLAKKWMDKAAGQHPGIAAERGYRG